MKSLAALPHPSDDAAWDARMKAALHEMFVHITPPKAPEPLPGFPVTEDEE